VSAGARVGAAAPRAVLLDALGTLVFFPPPWPLLVGELAARGVSVSLGDARAALRAEIGFYRAHHHAASDPPALARLRAQCTEVLGEHLPAAAVALGPQELQAALVASLRFTAYPEVPRVLDALAARGVVLVVVSNWDVSLHEVLMSTGLAGRFAAVLTSAEHGAAKPDPSIFRAALALAGVEDPADAWHVGDDLEADVGGARAAGITPVLVDRDEAPAQPGVRTVATLDGLLVP